jgi:hypothetical protein
MRFSFDIRFFCSSTFRLGLRSAKLRILNYKLPMLQFVIRDSQRVIP